MIKQPLRNQQIQESATKPPRNGLVELPKPVLAPSCSNCPCWHRSTNTEHDETCRLNPPIYSSTASCRRVWVHTLGTDYCWQHPALAQKRLQAASGSLEAVQAGSGRQNAV